MSEPRRLVYYTFGNHMHWVDMQWLWGYEVLPGSVRDMLRMIRETGVRGNVNFDGIGYEKMAAECPEALAELRGAVQRGEVEPVGCSYGQPYGLFHGGESNIRQRVFGVRAVMRLLDVRPRTFWEEEFDFFPQLPQMLRGCGFTGACLFFQWTWHTPEVPFEPHSLILWEGIDGTRLPCAPRNELNLHQWPEDFEPLFASKLLRELDRPAIVQWVELMPSKDWMCRSEVLLPKLKELLADPRFEMVPVTMGELLERVRGGRGPAAGERRAGTQAGRPDGADSREQGNEGAARCASVRSASDGLPPGSPASGASEGRPDGAAVPVRRYTMDDVWHGVSLGKNGDAHPRASRECEQQTLAAESLSALVGLFGRPYASWDVYPSWELDEAWRELLVAQHHDNHECEGLCGFIGRDSFARGNAMARRIRSRTVHSFERRLGNGEGRRLVFNTLGWPRDVVLSDSREPPWDFGVIRGVPAFGFCAPGTDLPAPERLPCVRIERTEGRIVLSRGAFRVEVDATRGVVSQMTCEVFPNGSLDPDRPLGAMQLIRHGITLRSAPCSDCHVDRGGRVSVKHLFADAGVPICIEFFLHPLYDALCINYRCEHVPRPDPGMRAALQAAVEPSFPPARLLHDTPFAVGTVDARADRRRKYPTGDWMTSPQFFEVVERPFTALTLVDCLRQAEERSGGLLYAHNGTQAFARTALGFRTVLTLYDPWDGDAYDGEIDMRSRIMPHAALTNSQRVRLARELLEPLRPVVAQCGRTGSTPADAQSLGAFGGVVVDPAQVVAAAYYRESMKAGENLPDWAGHRMARESNGACTHPYVVRLVEYNGEAAEVTLRWPGPVALAAKTNLMGEVGPDVAAGEDTAWLRVEHPVEPPEWARGAVICGQPVTWSAVRFRMRPREIATVMADLVMGRKQPRHLDAHRGVWATVHRR